MDKYQEWIDKGYIIKEIAEYRTNYSDDTDNAGLSAYGIKVSVFAVGQDKKELLEVYYRDKYGITLIENT